jgi:hypothetical protein
MKAFPEVNYVQPGQGGTSIMTVSGGMDLRDYFAAKAMQLFLHDSQKIHGQWNCESIAQDSYGMADAMMEARSK